MTEEKVWCERLWDWTLKVWGPTTAAEYNKKFYIIVSGVRFSNTGTA
jgi:hypothetical protein